MKAWFTIDDLPLIKSGEPILTIKRNGDKLDDVIIHRSAEELEQITRNDFGALGCLARLALEILSLRRDYAILLERWKEVAHSGD